MFGLVTLNQLREEPRARVVGRAVGVLFGLHMVGMALWWRYRLVLRGHEARHLDVFVGVLGFAIATSFVVRRPILLRALLLVSAPLFLYVIGGEGPPKWAGYGYLGTLLSAVLTHRGFDGERGLDGPVDGEGS